MNPSSFCRAGRWSVRAALALSALAVLGACSMEKKEFAEDLPEYRADLPDAEWAELSKRLPAVPNPDDKNLVVVEPAVSQSNFRFSVDPASIRVDPGRIVRYTLVSVSDMGAVNISYEGLRCGMRQVRNIAIARPNEGWQQAYNEAWRDVDASTRTVVQNLLYKGVLCAGGGPASMNEDVLRDRLRYWKRHAYGVEARQQQ